MGHYGLVAITFVLIFFALIVIHELGHFFVALWSGVKVEEFGFGLPPKVWGKKTKRTVMVEGKNGKKKKVTDEIDWTLNAIPFGGFVRMMGEESTKDCEKDPRAFCNRPLILRMAVTVAGVVMNFLLALFLLTIVAWTGFRPFLDPNLSILPQYESYFSDGHVDEWVDRGWYELDQEGVFVIQVEPESAADQAGIEVGDKILSINGTTINTRDQFAEIQNDTAPDQSLTYTIERTDSETESSEQITITATPQINDEGSTVLGVNLLDQMYEPTSDTFSVSLLQAPGEAWSSTIRFFRLSLGVVGNVASSTFGKVFQLEKPEIPEGVGGPVAIASTTSELVKLGDWSNILQFAAILSLSLAVLNLVPFPALDGGRFFFQLLEALFFFILFPIKKIFPHLNISHRIPAQLEMPIHVAGYALLLGFIVLVTFQDIVRIFGG